MKIETGKTGAEKKELIKAIETLTGQSAKYKGVPSCAYQIGDIVVTKEGTVESDNTEEMEAIAGLYALKVERGDEPVKAEEAHAEPEAEQEETGLCIEMPRAYFSEQALENLKRIVESKGKLIRKALGGKDLQIIVTEDKVSFPWFETVEGNEPTTYANLITKISEMARNSKRITAKEQTYIENEKYAFRCFLLRLGFIGDEYKEDRRILLQNLTGSSAFKSGERKAVEA